MIRIQVKGVQETLAEFSKINSQQVPYALALSLTRSAQGAQGVIRKENLPQRFTLRRRSWMEQGVRIKAATKAKPEAVIEDIHAFMALQEEGGTKTPSYGRYLAVPLRGARRTPRALIKPEDMPKAVMQSGLGFIRGGIMFRAYFKRGRGERVGQGVKGGARWSREIVPMYALVPRAHIVKRYGFEPKVVEVVNRIWPGEFEKAFNQAVQSAK